MKRFLAPLLAVLAGCTATLPRDGAAPGDYVCEFEDGVEAGREYRVHVPSGFDGTRALPLVIALHGYYSSPSKMAGGYGLDAVADREGFFVVYPEGTGALLGFGRHWNCGHLQVPAWHKGVDDMAFLDRVMGDAIARLRVDRDRVYIVGHSIGAMLALRYAAERPRAVAAVVSVAGTIGGLPNDREPEWRVDGPQSPVAAMFVHGDADRIVPYGGGEPKRKRSGYTCLSMAESVAHWVKANRCSSFVEDNLAKPPVERICWSGTEAVTAVTLFGWEHAWPGGSYRNEMLGDFDVAEEIWEFLRNRRRQP